MLFLALTMLCSRAWYLCNLFQEMYDNTVDFFPKTKTEKWQNVALSSAVRSAERSQ